MAKAKQGSKPAVWKSGSGEEQPRKPKKIGKRREANYIVYSADTLELITIYAS
jgi:hypothetical protein